MAAANWSARGISRLRRSGLREPRVTPGPDPLGTIKLNYSSGWRDHRPRPDEYVNTSQPPASTLVEVSGLFRDDALIEIEAVAIRA
jgi:hypothetical protein